MGKCNSKAHYQQSDDANNNIQPGNLEYTLKATPSLHSGAILGIASLGNGKVCSCSDDGTLTIFDVNTKQSLKLNGHTKSVNRVAAMKDYSSIWSVSRDLSIKQWNTDGQCIQTIENGHSLNVSGVSTDPGGRRVATGSRDYTVKIWDIETAMSTNVFSVPRNIVTCLEYATVPINNSALLFQGSEDLCVRVWDARLSAKSPAVHINNFIYFPTCISTLDQTNSSYLLLAGCKGFDSTGCEVKIFDIRMPTKAYSLLIDGVGHEQEVTGVSFLSNKIAASVSKDGFLRTWSTNPAQVTNKKKHCLHDNANYSSLATMEETIQKFNDENALQIQLCVGDRTGNLSFFTYSIQGSEDLTIAQIVKHYETSG